jgi:hypothetical protein
MHADTLTGHAELSRMFTVHANANGGLREQAGAACAWEESPDACAAMCH